MFKPITLVMAPKLSHAADMRHRALEVKDSRMNPSGHQYLVLTGLDTTMYFIKRFFFFFFFFSVQRRNLAMFRFGEHIRFTNDAGSS